MELLNHGMISSVEGYFLGRRPSPTFVNFFQEACSIVGAEGVDELLCVYWTSLVTSDFLGDIHSGRFAASWTSKPKWNWLTQYLLTS